MTLLGWTANVLLIAAMFLIGRKWRHAFLLTLAGEAIYVYECWAIERWDMLSLCVVFAALAAWNWWQWGREPVPGRGCKWCGLVYCGERCALCGACNECGCGCPMEAQ